MNRVLSCAMMSAAVGLAACSYSLLSWGSFPFDGQSNVPVDATLVLKSPGGISTSLPALGPGLTLIDVATDEPVAFDYEVVHEQGLISVTPHQPLRADRTYYLEGLNTGALGSAHSIVGLGWDVQAGPARATFHTGSRPEVLDAFLVEGQVHVALSEPVTEASLRASLQLSVVREDEVEVLSVEALAAVTDHLWQVSVAEQALLGPEHLLSVVCEGELETPSGKVVTVDTAFDGIFEDVSALDRYSHRPVRF